MWQIKYHKLSHWDVAYAINMAIACLIAYWIATSVLSRFIEKDSDLLGGMWAVVATVFVFRDSRQHSLHAGISRLNATLVSFVLCLIYLLIFPFPPVGLAALIGIGTLLMILLGRRDDIVSTGITTAVVMVVAALNPAQPWIQPPLRLIDTLVGIAIGVACKWIVSFLLYDLIGKEAQ